MSRFAQRRRKLRAELKRQGITAMLVTDELNVTYLSGFSGDSSYLLVLPKNTIIISDFRYISEIQSCLLYTSPSPRDLSTSRMPSSA